MQVKIGGTKRCGQWELMALGYVINKNGLIKMDFTIFVTEWRCSMGVGGTKRSYKWKWAWQNKPGVVSFNVLNKKNPTNSCFANEKQLCWKMNSLSLIQKVLIDLAASNSMHFLNQKNQKRTCLALVKGFPGI